MTAIFYGVEPAVIALILHSCCRLAKLGMEDWLQWAIAAVCFAVTVVLQAEVALLFIGAGIAGILYYGSLFRATPPDSACRASPHPSSIGTTQAASSGDPRQAAGVLPQGGRLTFGSGLVIVPFLEKGLVQEIGWLDPAPVPDRGRDRHDQPRAGGHHRDLRRLSRRRLLGLAGLDHRHLPAVVPADADRGADPARHRANPNVQGFVKGAYAAAIGTILGACVLLGTHRHRRLADGADRRRRAWPCCSAGRSAIRCWSA